jgi:hypothetical protein
VAEGLSADPSCPKCGRKRLADAEACPRCGLVFALWKEDPSFVQAKLGDRGEELWKNLAENWSNTAEHEEFLKHCLQQGSLAAAGRLYRERLDADPTDIVAVEMQKQVLAKATLNLSIHRTQPREPMTRSRWFWAILLAAMALGIAGGLFWRRFR